MSRPRAKTDTRPPGRRLAVAALHDLPVRAAYADVERLEEELAVVRLGVGQLRELGAARLARDHCHRSHDWPLTRISPAQAAACCGAAENRRCRDCRRTNRP